MGKWLSEKIGLCMECFIEIIFPKPSSCSGCGRELIKFDKYRLCSECFGKIKKYEAEGENVITDTDFDNVIISCCYEGLVREMIHKIKYKDKREIALTIAALMADEVNGAYLNYDLIVPVPISLKKLKKRGYNHVYIIARELSELIKVPVLDCIRRVKDTEPQILFNSIERWYNVKDCFEIDTNLYAKKILLLDDVITTGATAHYCAAEIKKAGAAKVTVCSFARSNLM